MQFPQKSFIGGTWRDGRSQAIVRSVDPARSDEVLVEARGASADDVNDAVAAAVSAYPSWRATPAPERARVLGRVAELARSRADELASAVTFEEGKTLPDARAEVEKAIEILSWFAGEGWRHTGRMLATDVPDTMAYTVREPLGVVGLITPWNVPFALPCWKIAPALVAGNTAVLKPATFAPGSALLVASLFEEAGLPAGVLSVLLGSGAEVGQAMAVHPDVKAFSFTGSPGAREKLYDLVSHRLARLDWIAPEAGGKNAIILLRDADLELAAAGILHGAFASTGQRCTAASRLIVEEAVADEMVERLTAGANALKVGAGHEPGVDMGPVIDGRQLQRLLDAVARANGDLVAGGRRKTEDGMSRGWFMAPTILDRVAPDAPIAREELFGPVLTVTRVSDFEEALRVANDSPHRLAGAIYTRDAERIMQFTQRADARMLHVNAPTIGGEPHQPYGGIRTAGVQGLAREGLDFFTEVKTVFVDWGGARRKQQTYY